MDRSDDQDGLLAKLVATEQIKQLKARFLQALDMQDWDALSECLVEDCVMDFRGGTTRPETGWMRTSRREYIDEARERMKARTTVHMACMPQITVDDETRASGTWMLSDYIDSAADSGRPTKQEFGRYHDEYRKENGAWLISGSRLERLVVNHYSRPASQPQPAAEGQGPSRRGRGA